ncbi:uncharacterized protein LOC131700495 isoform X2 [Acipenser ruthenus]|nr:uncharacterized protein LOC131700495 isoform X2 [Acipenser ruthenus]
METGIKSVMYSRSQLSAGHSSILLLWCGQPRPSKTTYRTALVSRAGSSHAAELVSWNPSLHTPGVLRAAHGPASSLKKGIGNVIRIENTRCVADMSAVQYLCAHCRCDEALGTLFKTAFSQQDRDRDGLLSMKETEQALLSLFILHPDHLSRLRELLRAGRELRTDLPLFTAISALTTRVLLKEPQ